MLRLLCFAALFYVLALVALTLLQRKLIYLPFHRSEAEMLRFATELRLDPWRDDFGTIIGWKRIAARRATPANRLVVFHGNAGFALMRNHFVEGFEALEDGALWEVYLFEYPSFGARAGPLGQQAFLEAGRAALAELMAADARAVFLVGESLGSGLACALARERPESVAGLFLLTPFPRLVDVAQHHYPWVPVRMILRDTWDNTDALLAYRGPLAVMLAGEDEVIPVALGRKLYESGRSPKRLWVEAGSGHNALPFDVDAPWWREVSDFLLTHRRVVP